MVTAHSGCVLARAWPLSFSILLESRLKTCLLIFFQIIPPSPLLLVVDAERLLVALVEQE